MIRFRNPSSSSGHNGGVNYPYSQIIVYQDATFPRILPSRQCNCMAFLMHLRELTRELYTSGWKIQVVQYTHVIGDVKNHSCTNQETDNPPSGTVRNTHFSTIAISFQGCSQHTSAINFRLDRLYHRPQLAARQSSPL